MSYKESFTYTLYSTVGCHLCDVAMNEIVTHFPEHKKRVGVCDIACDDDLVLLYGEKIPVLENNSTHKTLEWPFSKDALATFFNE